MLKESTVDQIVVFFSATSSLAQSKAAEASFIIIQKQKQSHQVPSPRLAEAIIQSEASKQSHVRHV